MNLTSAYLMPAILVSYDKVKRTAMVNIPGLTDGEPNGIGAMIAYPVGDDDLDTERELIPGADVWVFFENGDTTMPVIAFYRRHGKGRAVTDVGEFVKRTLSCWQGRLSLSMQPILSTSMPRQSISALTISI